MLPETAAMELAGLAPYMPAALRALVLAPAVAAISPEEIRLRAERPLHVVGGCGDGFITAAGEVTARPELGRRVTSEDVQTAFQLVTRGSVYAWEEELRNGFVTLPGGHRVGVCGRAVVAGGQVSTLRSVSGLNYRVARALQGAARRLIPFLISDAAGLVSTLLISVPQAGKTTLLRDLVRLASYGAPELGLKAGKVVVVDERSELAGGAGGGLACDLGPRTDVLDGCPKSAGMLLAVRSLSPQVLAVDEIGAEDDARAVMAALQAGVCVLATVHGSSLGDVKRRPGLGRLLRAGAFQRGVVLGRQCGPGTVEQVWDLSAGQAEAARSMLGTLLPPEVSGSVQAPAGPGQVVAPAGPGTVLNRRRW